MKSTLILLANLTLLLIMSQSLVAQETLHRNFIGAASGVSTENDGITLQATVGQPIANQVELGGQTHYAGFWAPIDYVLDVEDGQVDTPLSLTNYPNPFSANTTIKFDLPSNSDVTIRIYSINGNIVKELKLGVISAGVQSAQWDGADVSGEKVSSGTYLYELTISPVGGVISGNKIQARNIMVVSK